MFEKKSIPSKLFWTLLIFGGWILVAFLSQFIGLNDSTIITNRHMFDLRWLRIIIVLVGYGLLFVLKYNWKRISYLFFIGFMMEFILFISGIRPGNFLILLENSLIEFNMGFRFSIFFMVSGLRKK